ncbi:hypothetical protein MMC20_002477 [Loxospora ochrophaea]|nr:hypothetical protein [Loxospora ochrophaea]
MAPYIGSPGLGPSISNSGLSTVRNLASDSSGMASKTRTLTHSKKRKRDQKLPGEIEVDVAAPEPPSKKALRKAKKNKAAIAGDIDSPIEKADNGGEVAESTTPPKGSEYGVWIGNLPWTATKIDLRKFLTENTKITEDMITRVHLPSPSRAAIAASKQKIKPQNKGFAYVDFSTSSAMEQALALSENLLTGRRILIKDAKSFEGRPEKPAEDVQPTGNPPSRRIFIGNLGFDTTKDELRDHFAQCGDISDVHVATFEDSGKCKGYAWVEFNGIESGEMAIRGWVDSKEAGDTMDDDGRANIGGLKVGKKRQAPKRWVNRIKGRSLRMEFAEDKSVRYKKRFGKNGNTIASDSISTEGLPPGLS